MAVSYNKLWKLLIDKGMTKTQMRLKADISTTTLAKLGKKNGCLIEGRGCPGGCVAGAGTITPVKKSTAAVTRYVNEAKVKSVQDSAAVKRLREVQD